MSIYSFINGVNAWRRTPALRVEPGLDHSDAALDATRSSRLTQAQTPHESVDFDAVER